MDIEQVINQYHESADQFSRGNSQPIKMLYSHEDDVFLANPFGLTVIGWNKVSDALDFASSKFTDGEVKNFELIAKYLSAELAIVFEIEKWKAKVGGRQEVSSFDLRVTTTFRKEGGDWKVVHRHADPIASFNAEGPLRGDL
jgi:ketosteroid isomerase-like protein